MPSRSLDRGTGQFRLPFEDVAGAPEPLASVQAVSPVLPPAADGVPAGPTHSAPEPPLTVHYVRNRRARRYIVRVRPDGVVRVTIPRGGSQGEAASFVHRHRAWVDDQLRKLSGPSQAAARPLHVGDCVLVRGVPMPVTVEPARRGRVKVTLADAPACLTAPCDDLRPAVTAMLRALAQRELPARLLALAAGHGLAVARVTVRNQRSRWGSCSTSGSISLNWRLVQMPPEVRDYVLVHELMHLREANHSRRFWRHVARACPWHLEARRWLTREGKALL